MTPDTHNHRETILEWPQDRVEAFIQTLQENRLLARKKIEHATKLQKIMTDKRERDRAAKALEMMVKEFASIEKKLAKIHDKWSYVRMLAMQEGIDIYTDAPDVPTEEVDDEGTGN